MFKEFPDLMTPIECSKALRINRNKIYELLASGEIRKIMIGRKILVPKCYLIEYVERKAS